ncbi:MAG: ATP-dependent DNA helicase [Candidatus Saccharibacteria bacterium]|nr:ATP-dependent DNA helicase [Candidatus Saccharibacteria bacterium]
MKLNEKQKEAVEYLEGPLLVLAGPGTGKTQLLSSKVEYILKNTDTDPSNILCLTFTESGAFNMRERLKSLIGKDALKVNIGTYHAFGQGILSQYKQFSSEYQRALESAIDEVVQFKIVKNLQKKLPASDILAGDKVKDIISVISEAKSAGLDAFSLEKIANQNIEDNEVLSKAISPLLLNVVPRKFKESYEKAYLPIYELLSNYVDLPPIVGNIERSIVGMARDLKTAILEAESTQKITPLTSWKDDYFDKDDKGGYRLKDRIANKKLKSVAVLMKWYQEYLEKEGLFDFDDMIIEALKVLHSNLAFKKTLQEKYQFVMLDEFQDTNPMQFAIIKELTDYEKPLIMAVGDDDQAIYEFQGATATNLSDFQEYYDAKVCTLTENYRSTQEILDFSREIINQAPNRFSNEKILTAHKENPVKSQVERVEFLSSDQEYSFVAEKIADLIKKGVKQTEIAVISSKHKYFTPLLPYLKEHPEINIAYERRDNLLEDTRIHEIITLLKLAQEVAEEKKPTVSMLEVLAYPWLNVPVLEAVRLVAEAREAHKGVFDYLLSAETTPEITEVMNLIAELSAMAFSEPLELVFNKIIEKMHIESLEPAEMFKFYENLASLRAKLIKYVGDKPLRIKDLVEMADDYADADMQLTSSSPYRDADEAVQVLSAHKAKGLEFEYVFIISADHMAWGKGKGNNNLLSLPKNLQQIRHTGMTDGEQIRLLYVALTRAKNTLFISNSLHDFAGKAPDRLEYFDEKVEKLEDGTERITAPLLPSGQVLVSYGDNGSADQYSAKLRAVQSLKDYLKPFTEYLPDMRSVYKERIKNYRMSASSLTSFIDIVNAGPEEFFKRNVLRSEMEPEDESLAIGNLFHATFEKITNSGISDDAAVKFFLSELEKRDLPLEIKDRIREVGPAELAKSLKDFSKILKAGKAEVDFSFEHIAVDGVPITGKIDHISIDDENKTIEIYDFKTSKGKYRKKNWGSHPTLYMHTLQLAFYKLLLNNSPTYAKYKVEKAHILFVRPDDDGEVYDKVYEFNKEDEKTLKDLLSAVYYQISDLKFLDDKEVFVPANKELKLKDIKDFITLLLAKNSKK